MEFPFEQYIKEGKMVRVFTPDVPADESNCQIPNKFQFQNLYGTG